MGLIDDIKNMQPVSTKVFTAKDLIKIIKSIRKSKGNNKVIYQREKVEQDGDDERRNAIK
jgi:hypothetical protein